MDRLVCLFAIQPIGEDNLLGGPADEFECKPDDSEVAMLDEIRTAHRAACESLLMWLALGTWKLSAVQVGNRVERAN